ncbi:hypothetical protein G5B10_06100 [Fluviicola sp. SGL-29]|nr:hypothetical protein [Fluviicola sp. SGL-29]
MSPGLVVSADNARKGLVGCISKLFIDANSPLTSEEQWMLKPLYFD